MSNFIQIISNYMDENNRIGDFYIDNKTKKELTNIETCYFVFKDLNIGIGSCLDYKVEEYLTGDAPHPDNKELKIIIDYIIRYIKINEFLK